MLLLLSPSAAQRPLVEILQPARHETWVSKWAVGESWVIWRVVRSVRESMSRLVSEAWLGEWVSHGSVSKWVMDHESVCRWVVSWPVCCELNSESRSRIQESVGSEAWLGQWVNHGLLSESVGKRVMGQLVSPGAKSMSRLASEAWLSQWVSDGSVSKWVMNQESVSKWVMSWLMSQLKSESWVGKVIRFLRWGCESWVLWMSYEYFEWVCKAWIMSQFDQSWVSESASLINRSHESYELVRWITWIIWAGYVSVSQLAGHPSVVKLYESVVWVIWICQVRQESVREWVSGTHLKIIVINSCQSLPNSNLLMILI